MRKMLLLVALAISLTLLTLIGTSSSQGGKIKAHDGSGPIISAGFQVAPEQKHRGLSWVGSRQIGPEHLESVVETNANWIVQTPFAWQATHENPHIRLSTKNNGLWGESDEGLVTTSQLARAKGIRVLLKPHIWLTHSAEGKWRSDIAMTSEHDWKLWWQNYRMFMMHYAQLAETHGIEALCVGTELASTVVTRETDWRALIKEVRGVYGGKLIYAANWFREYDLLTFWDALDWIGIQAYFPIAKQPGESTQQLVAGWLPHLKSIAAVARRFQKPVIFTEAGYRATVDSAVEPWLWPKRRALASAAGLQSQARCYQAFFDAVWHQPWLAGAYIWKWHPVKGTIRGVRSRSPGQGFSPQYKPAHDVLLRYYSGSP